MMDDSGMTSGVKSFFSWSMKDEYELTGRGAIQAQGAAWIGKIQGVRVKVHP